jgi:hypothetical protein
MEVIAWTLLCSEEMQLWKQRITPTSNNKFRSLYKWPLLLWYFRAICRNNIKKKTKLSLCLTNYGLRHEDVWWSGCIAPYLFDLGTNWRWVVSFTSCQLHPAWTEPPLPIGQESGWASESVWSMWRRGNDWTYWESNSDFSTVQFEASRHIDCVSMALI